MVGLLILVDPSAIKNALVWRFPDVNDITCQKLAKKRSNVTKSSLWPHSKR